MTPNTSKTVPSDTSADSLITVFKSIGLSQSKAAEAAKNSKSATVLKDIIERHALTEKSNLDEKQAGLLAAFAAQISKSERLGEAEKAYVVGGILEGRLKSVDQVTGE